MVRLTSIFLVGLLPCVSPILKGIDPIISPDLLKGILKLFPLDTQVEEPAMLMDVTDKDKAKGMATPKVWSSFQKILDKAEHRKIGMQKLKRESFYERAKKAFAVVSTGETALYGNLIIKFGVVAPEKKDDNYPKKYNVYE